MLRWAAYTYGEHRGKQTYPRNGYAKRKHLSQTPKGPLPCGKSALPKAWKSGSIKGICLKGDATMDLTWEAGQLAGCRILAKSGLKTNLRYADKILEIVMEAGEEKCFQVADFR